MKRIMEPLTQMGADIRSQQDKRLRPLLDKQPSPCTAVITPTKGGFRQVKSCILLAGMYADAPTSVTEPSGFPECIGTHINYFSALGG